MRLLAIDTALDACSVAVVAGDRTVALSEAGDRGHAERLMAMIAETLAAAGVSLAGIERIAVTVGPGSFTGTRIGIAAARALALANGTPTVGITTLAVHAAEARPAFPDRPVLAVIAAGRGELYGMLTAADGSEAHAPAVGSAQAMVTRIPSVEAESSSSRRVLYFSKR